MKLNRPLQIRTSMINNIDSGVYSQEIKDQIDHYEVPLTVPVIKVSPEDSNLFDIISGEDEIRTMKDEGFEKIWCLVIFSTSDSTDKLPNPDDVTSPVVVVPEGVNTGGVTKAAIQDYQKRKAQKNAAESKRVEVQEVTIYKGSKNQGFKTERGAKSAKTRLSKQSQYQGFDLRVTKRDGVYVIRIKEIEVKREYHCKFVICDAHVMAAQPYFYDVWSKVPETVNAGFNGEFEDLKL